MKKWSWIFYLAMGAFFSWIAYQSTNFGGGEDGVMHHLFALYVPQHPENLLDHWGKPLYILLSFPFAQLGFYGSVAFNIICGLLAAFFTVKASRAAGLRYSFAAAIFVLFAPEFFVNVPSAVTEIVFSLVLIFSVYLLFIRQYIWAAILISFLPYARTEGNIVVLMFALSLLSLRRWKALPFVFTGTVAYSIAGYFHFKDILWIWHRHPYGDASDIYHHGTFLHYVDSSKLIWGLPLFFLVLTGTFFFIIRTVRIIMKKESAGEWYFIWLFAIFGSFYAYLFGHSYVWWKGISGSFGLIRVMAGTMPLAALIGLYGLNAFTGIFNPNLKIFRTSIVLIFVYLVVSTNFKIHRLPFTGDHERELILEAGEWYRNSEYFRAPKIYYFAPSVAQAFEVDPFSSERGFLESTVREVNDMPSGTIIVWDAHFGNNECRLPVDSIRARSEFEQVAHFRPDFEMKTLNGYDYEIYLFRRK